MLGECCSQTFRDHSRGWAPKKGSDRGSSDLLRSRPPLSCRRFDFARRKEGRRRSRGVARESGSATARRARFRTFGCASQMLQAGLRRIRRTCMPRPATADHSNWASRRATRDVGICPATRSREDAVSRLLFCVFPRFSPFLRPGARSRRPPERADHASMGAHHMNFSMGSEKCAPTYTYDDGPAGPDQWSGVCQTGNMQSPVNIRDAEQLPLSGLLKFSYATVDLDVINDCNAYRILVRFPDNDWLKVGRKPYFLTELHFRHPGENAVNGWRRADVRPARPPRSPKAPWRSSKCPSWLERKIGP